MAGLSVKLDVDLATLTLQAWPGPQNDQIVHYLHIHHMHLFQLYFIDLAMEIFDL